MGKSGTEIGCGCGNVRYVSTKEYSHLGPVAYRQWRADSHCKLIHGYALSFRFGFEACDLDARNWVVDYGSLKPLKGLLEEWFDHKLLVAEDDPDMDAFKMLADRGLAKLTIVEKTGCEGIADFLIRYINEQWLPLYYPGDRVSCAFVEVRETPSNMAYVLREYTVPRKTTSELTAGREPETGTIDREVTQKDIEDAGRNTTLAGFHRRGSYEEPWKSTPNQ